MLAVDGLWHDLAFLCELPRLECIENTAPPSSADRTIKIHNGVRRRGRFDEGGEFLIRSVLDRRLLHSAGGRGGKHRGHWLDGRGGCIGLADGGGERNADGLATL